MSTAQSGAAALTSLSHPLLFDLIEADAIVPAIDTLLIQAREALGELERVEEPNYERVMSALDLLDAPLQDAYTLCSQLESLLGTPELREAYRAIQPKVSSFYATLPFSSPLFERVKRVAQSTELATLSPAQQRYTTMSYEGFVKAGAELDDATKQRLEQLSVKLSEVTNRFAKNVVDATDAFSHLISDEALLAGLPDSAREAARLSAEAKGQQGWRFTLQGPSLLAALTYLDHRETRELIYKAHNTRASSGERDNAPLMAEILALRAEKAQLLGFKNVADLHLDDRMVKRGDDALDFVERLVTRTHAPFKAEHEALKAFCRDELGWGFELEAWDLAYAAEKMRQHSCDFDQELLRPYFELHGVMRGMFEVVSKLYGVSFKALDELPRWHSDVLVYEMREPDGRRSVFYADLFPREGKQGGAWMCPLLYGDGSEERPLVGLICGNFTPPIDGRSLLSHREVETLFHEFGHLLHHLLTRADIRAQAGTNVAWDFVELPSQIMENWCWEREALNLFARHYESDEVIPDELFERLTRARTFRAATAQMRQLSFATVDLLLHTQYQAAPLERFVDEETRAEEGARALQFACEVMSELSPTSLFEGYAMINGFTHLFASPVGYAAGYYSYKWAEVLDADAFSRFKQEGLFSPEVGEAFRSRLLSRGSSADPKQLFVDFMGREPDLEPLFARNGLA